MNKMFLVAGLAAFGLIAGACQLDVERNADGSLQIEAVISEAAGEFNAFRGFSPPRLHSAWRPRRAPSPST